MYQNALEKILALPLPVSVQYFSTHILQDAMSEETQIDITALTEEILNKMTI